MTIEVQGHVHSLEFVGMTEIEVTVQLDSNRAAHSPHRLKLRVKPAEIDMYRIGMAIMLQIRPNP